MRGFVLLAGLAWILPNWPVYSRSTTRNPRVDRLNRVVLALLGLLVLGAGGLGLVAGAGVFPGHHDPQIFPTRVRDYARTTNWFWWAVAGACLVIAVLALRWLADQLRTERASRLDLTTESREGVTMVHASAITDAVAQEAEALRGVTRATAGLRDRPGQQPVLAVDLADFADIAAVRAGLEGTVVAHARQVVDDPTLPVDIELRQGRARSGDRGLR